MASSPSTAQRGTGRWARRVRLGWAIGLGLAVVLLSARIAGAIEEPSLLRASVENDLLTLEARGVSRGEILNAIGEAAGFRVYAAPGAAGTIDLSLVREPVERALTRILQGTSAVLVYEPGPVGGESRLSEVRLLGSVDDSAMADPASAHSPRIEAVPGLAAGTGSAARLREVHALAGRADADAVATLAFAAEHDEAPVVRRAAVDALGKLRIGRAREALIAALSDDDRHVGRCAVAALVRTWGEKAAPPLARVLAGDADPAMRRLAADALGRIGGETALMALLEAQSDLEPRVRQAVAASLARRRGSPS